MIEGKAEVHDGDNREKSAKAEKYRSFRVSCTPISSIGRQKTTCMRGVICVPNTPPKPVMRAQETFTSTTMADGARGWGGGWANGWMWNPYYSSWAFVPGDSYFYDPFGWGFYSPRYIAYAPIYYVPGSRRPVPVNPGRPPVVSGGLRGGVAGRAGVAALASPARGLD